MHGGDITGLFASYDGGMKWERVPALPARCWPIWSLTIDPVDPDILFAGTRPAGVYRSRDGGQHWEKLPVDIASECSIGTPFVTGLAVDPDDHRRVWAGVEIDGIYRSMDGGDSWTHQKTGLYDPDIHALAIAATQPKRASMPAPRARSLSATISATPGNAGNQGEMAAAPMPAASRSRPTTPGVLYAGCGEGTTGEKGHVLRTTDYGQRWEILPLLGEANATMWGLATHPADAERIVAFSLFGEAWLSPRYAGERRGA